MTIYYGYEEPNGLGGIAATGIDADLLALMNQPILIENVITNPNVATNNMTATGQKLITFPLTISGTPQLYIQSAAHGGIEFTNGSINGTYTSGAQLASAVQLAFTDNPTALPWFPYATVTFNNGLFTIGSSNASYQPTSDEYLRSFGGLEAVIGFAQNTYFTSTPPSVVDGYGRHFVNTSGGSGSAVEYGPATQYLCRLEYQTKVLATINGRDLVSSGRAYLNGFYLGISTESRVTLPNVTNPAQEHPIIMFVEQNYDENGLTGYNTVLHFE